MKFRGYYVDPNDLLEESGVYCVYRCKHDTADNKVKLEEVIYIGEADSIKTRVSNHERMSNWKKRCSEREKLCYSMAKISSPKCRRRAEAALIFEHKPVLNIEHKETFVFGPTRIRLRGKTAKLRKKFVAKPGGTT